MAARILASLFFYTHKIYGNVQETMTKGRMGHVKWSLLIILCKLLILFEEISMF